MNEKAHLFSPVFGARAEGNINKANGPLGSHRTAQNSVLGHSRVLWATAHSGNALSTTNATLEPILDQGP